MQNTNLSKLLATINKEEMKAFGCYLKGMHPGRKRIHKVQEYLAKSHPNYEVSRMARPRVMKKVFGQIVQEVSLLNLYNELRECLEEFLATQEIKSNPFIKYYLLMKRFARQAKPELLKKIISRAEKSEAEDQKKNGLELFSFLRKLQISYWAYYGIGNKSVNQSKEVLLKAIYNLDLFCKGSKLKFDLELANRHNILSDTEDENTINVVDTTNKSTDPILLKLYQIVEELFIKFGHSKLLEFKDLFFQYHQYLHVNEKVILYSYLINLAIEGIRKDSSLIREAFSIIQLGEENSFFLDQRFLSPTRIQNIVTIASYLEDYDWLDNFFKKNNLDEENEYLESISKIVESQVDFAKGEYERVLEKLNDIKFKSILFEMSRRHLILKSYYELEEDIDVMLDFCRAYESFIKRKELGARIIEASLAFTKIFRYIIRGKHTKPELLNLVNSIEHLHHRDWLLEKINMLPK